MVAATPRPRTLVIVGIFLRATISLLLAMAGAMGASSIAHAHADLDFSTPEDGEQLEVAPAEVRLTFNEELFAELVEVSVLDADGNLVMATEAEQTPPPGTDVIFPWPTDLEPGQYSVAYRVVSEDGHPVTGQITFSYTSVPEPTSKATPEVTPEVTAEATTEQTAQETAEPTPSLFATDDATTDPTPEAIAAGEPDSSLIGPLLIGAAIVVGIGVVFSIVMLARSRQ